MSTGCQKTIFQYVNMSVCQYVRMQLFSLFIKMKVVQNVQTISENIISVCQHVSMSICPYVNMLICQNATFQLRYQNESCSKCHKDVRQSLCHYVKTSICQFFNMSVCQNSNFQLRYQNERYSECHHDVR